MFVRQPQTFDTPFLPASAGAARHERSSAGIVASLMARLASLLAARNAAGLARPEAQAALHRRQDRRHRSDLFAAFPGD